MGAQPAPPATAELHPWTVRAPGAGSTSASAPRCTGAPRGGSGPLFSSLSGCEDLYSCDRVEVGSVLSYNSYFLQSEGELNVSGTAVAAQCGTSTCYFFSSQV